MVSCVSTVELQPCIFGQFPFLKKNKYAYEITMQCVGMCKQFDVFSPKLIYILCQSKAVYFIFPVVSKKTGADTQIREVGTIIIM